MTRDEAAAAARAYGNEQLAELGPREWRLTSFDGGWLAVPEGDDLRWRTGLPCLIVLDDGAIHEESSSLPPPELFAKYGNAEPRPQGVALAASPGLIYALGVDEICTDLAAEHEALDRVVADATEEQWTADTAAAGWDVADTIVHLIQADMAATLAVTDADGFQEAKANTATGGFDAVFGTRSGKSGTEILAWWRDERSKMLEAFRARGPKERIPWFGPDMSTLSFATARLMETWSHGQDVADALAAPWPATDRLRHVAHIGVSTRGWSYVNRGEPVPEGDVRVELTAPSGAVWTWGPDDATDRVVGPALDFCLVVTQRRHLDDVDLEITGDLASGWMTIAQAFAGPPTLPQGDRKEA